MTLLGRPTVASSADTPKDVVPGDSQPATRRPDSTRDFQEVSEVVRLVERWLPGTGIWGNEELLFCKYRVSIPRDAQALGLPCCAAPAANRTEP